ncbi:hypothetical protein VSH64_10995 [Amycolatopsis rhabdoformis]|uniref:Uncharacterized protein n=1 Tax=Amycolatopsis rhabdoformis TaxID=1448059 RepID=A0ABZ1IEF5_9PSEU|nr:hypothetical protein [Amycolatopsis rhabdoformis]WSE32632.1 hypothetical protein VSH64_10995 [Amycolatopsis rhabdoformis]
MSGLTFTLVVLGGLVLIALVLRLAGSWLDAHDEDPYARRTPPGQ